MTQPPPESDLHNDLQQFLYDARDQFLALENIRGELREIADTTVSQRKAVADTGQKLDRAIKNGVDVKVNTGLDSSLALITQATSELNVMSQGIRTHANQLLYIVIAATMIAAFAGASAGLYITLRLL